MEWRDYVKETYVKMKKKNPGATLKQAMIASKEPYRRMKDNLYKVRGELVEGRRQLARNPKLSAKAKKKNLKDADRIEVVRYADVLRDMGYDMFDDVAYTTGYEEPTSASDLTSSGPKSTKLD
jgi:hypothetical protein